MNAYKVVVERFDSNTNLRMGLILHAKCPSRLKTIVPKGSVTLRKFCRSDETNFCKQTQSQTKTSFFSIYDENTKFFENFRSTLLF